MSLALTEAGIRAAAAALAVDPAVVRAVAEVESNGSGFLRDGRPTILFEGHIFSRRTGGIHDADHPTISYPRWTTAHYLGGAREYGRLAEARSLNDRAAFESASWGAFQIMGFNAEACGFADVYAFVDAMHESADRHLEAFVAFVRTNRLDGYLRRCAWESFAAKYNGPGQVPYYAGKLAAAHRRHREAAPPSGQSTPSAPRGGSNVL